jgi:amidase/aspartyl-tRNA(Asn)/glutamyl-tRNA(Gln) amidotransferase subunit A
MVIHSSVAVCEILGTISLVTFREWQQLTPEEAAREVGRRERSSLREGQSTAVFSALLSEADMAAAFSKAAQGPLRGVPYVLKDLFDVDGLPTFGGSSFLAEVRRPGPSAAIARDLGAAGAVLVAKTHLFEFAWGLTGENAHYGDCEHPGFPGRTTGGSSSGSAAAVAAGIVPLAVGTDTGGSIRVPSAFCGLYGYRGVPGDAWARDCFPLAPSFDTAGFLTRTADDLKAALGCLVGLPAAPGKASGIYLEMPGVDADVCRACRDLAAVFSSEAPGALRAELQSAFSPAAEVYGVMAGLESWRIHRKWASRSLGRYGPLLVDRLERARAISQAQVAAVGPSHKTIRDAWDSFFGSHDFLVMPAVPFGALLKADCTQGNRLRMLSLTAPASLAGLPVLTIPVPLPSGLTAGLQFIFRDARSPAMASVLEALVQSSA